MFDPYQEWLGIPPGPRPPSYYELLGLPPQIEQGTAIAQAAIRQTNRLRGHESGPHAAVCAQLREEVKAAWQTLADPARRGNYDERLAKGNAVPVRPAPIPAEHAEANPFALPSKAAVARPRRPRVRQSGKLPWMLLIGIGLAMHLTIAGAGTLIWYLRKPATDSEAKEDKSSHVRAGGERMPKEATREKSPRRPKHARTDDPPSPEPTPQPEPTPEPKPASMSPVGQPARAPAPDEAAQTKATKSLKQLYKVDYAKEKREDKLALALKLFQLSRAPKETPVNRFVLLREARDLAAGAGDALGAVRAVDELARDFAVDGIALKSAALVQVEQYLKEHWAKKPVNERALVTLTGGLMDVCLTVSEQAAQADQFDAAARLLQMAEAAEEKIKKRLPMPPPIERLKKDLATMRQEYARVQDAALVLAKRPADPEANLARGRFLCFFKGDWDAGLPHLVQVKDARLKELAKNDLDRPTAPEEQLELGAGWWEYSQTDAGRDLPRLQMRAYFWLRQARPSLAGLNRMKLDEILKQLPILFLSDMEEFDVLMGPFKFGKGELNGLPILFRGQRSPNGLGMHPPEKNPASVKYDLDKKARLFQASVALNDSAGAGAASPVTFLVLGDGKLLWTSRPVQATGEVQDVSVSVVGVRVLQLRVLCADKYEGAHAVWLEPRILR